MRQDYFKDVSDKEGLILPDIKTTYEIIELKWNRISLEIDQ